MLQKLENLTVSLPLAKTPVKPVSSAPVTTSPSMSTVSTPTLPVTAKPAVSFVSPIPQLDGDGSRDILQPSVKCDSCCEVFESQDLLNEHIEKYEYTCEDCRLCFSSEYEHDVHEHTEHPSDYFKYNKVSPRTKQNAIRYLTANL